MSLSLPEPESAAGVQRELTCAERWSLASLIPPRKKDNGSRQQSSRAAALRFLSKINRYFNAKCKINSFARGVANFKCVELQRACPYGDARGSDAIWSFMLRIRHKLPALLGSLCLPPDFCRMKFSGQAFPGAMC